MQRESSSDSKTPSAREIALDGELERRVHDDASLHAVRGECDRSRHVGAQVSIVGRRTWEQARFGGDLAVDPVDSKRPPVIALHIPRHEVPAIPRVNESIGLDRPRGFLAGLVTVPKAQSQAWSCVTYVSALVRLQYAASDHVEAQMHNEAVAEHTGDELRSLLDILDARLGEAPFLLGTDYSLADLVVSSVIGYGAMTGVRVDSHSNVSRWLAACQAQPSVRSILQG
jgi:hypothetical protein